MPNEILSLLSLDHLGPVEAEETLKKILNDSFVMRRADEISRRAWLVAAVQSLHFLERQALAKRCGPAPKAPVIVFRVEESILSGRWFIRSLCPQCQATFGTDDGPEALKRDPRWVHCCVSIIPEGVLAEYAERFPTNKRAAGSEEYFRAMQPSRQMTHSELTERERQRRENS